METFLQWLKDMAQEPLGEALSGGYHNNTLDRIFCAIVEPGLFLEIFGETLFTFRGTIPRHVRPFIFFSGSTTLTLRKQLEPLLHVYTLYRYGKPTDYVAPGNIAGEHA